MSRTDRMRAVPEVRIRRLNEAPYRETGAFVVYWMVANRRARSNFALQHAIALAKRFDRPLIVLEALRAGYRWANDRLHRFVMQGMADNQAAFSKTPLLYYPYVEPTQGAGAGMLETLAAQACAVISDDFPCFFLPQMQSKTAERLKVRLEVVDSNGLYPMHATARVFSTAHSFRVHLQKELKAHLLELPIGEPLKGLTLPTLDTLPRGFESKWPRSTLDFDALDALPIDHSVPPAKIDGGSVAGLARMQLFVDQKLADYTTLRNEPATDGTSYLSPYLHFGHVSAHQVFAKIAATEDFDPDTLGKSIGGAKSGWWQMSDAAESFIDELVTWRELAFNMSSHRDDYASFDTLPQWAQATLKEHQKDPRPHRYSLQQLEAAQTHDELWNAAQRQLTRDGWFHNYLRMLWGKKILEWSDSPIRALATMEQLMGKHSLDGRNPCSYSGYFWVLGRYDRAWGERPIFGKVRFMSSDNTARKLDVKPYLKRYSA